MAGWGTKKPMSTKIPAAIEIRRGISRFMRSASLGGEELGQAGAAEGQKNAAEDDREDQEDLDRVGGFEAPEEPRVLREIGAGGVVLLPDQRVVAGDDEEGQLVDVGGARDLDGPRLVPRLREEERLGEERSEEEVRGRAIASSIAARPAMGRKFQIFPRWACPM